MFWVYFGGRGGSGKSLLIASPAFDTYTFELLCLCRATAPLPLVGLLAAGGVFFVYLFVCCPPPPSTDLSKVQEHAALGRVYPLARWCVVLSLHFLWDTTL